MREYSRLGNFSEGRMIFCSEGYESSKNTFPTKKYCCVVPLRPALEYFSDVDAVCRLINRARTDLVDRYNATTPKKSLPWRDLICRQVFRNPKTGRMEHTLFEVTLSTW